MFFRDFVCVEDLVAIVLSNRKRSGIYDLGTSEPISFKDVAEYVAECYNVEIEFIPFPEHLIGKYQEFTCAKREWDDYKFIKVHHYLK